MKTLSRLALVLKGREARRKPPSAAGCGPFLCIWKISCSAEFYRTFAAAGRAVSAWNQTKLLIGLGTTRLPALLTDYSARLGKKEGLGSKV